MANSQVLVQQQQQRQIQTANLQQVQFAHLLELPSEAMDDELRKATEENPALERIEREDDDTLSTSSDDNATDVRINLDGGLIDRAESGRVRRSNEEPSTGDYSWVASTEGDSDLLLQQLSELDLSDDDRQIMEYLIGSLSDDGYIEKDDETLANELAFTLYIYPTPDDIHRLIEQLQSLEPIGIGAHSLQECLLLQLRARQEHTESLVMAKTLAVARGIISDCLEDYANRRWDKVCRTLDITRDELQEADTEIRRCNPRPGRLLTSQSERAAQTVQPDFYLTVDEEEQIEVALRWGSEPQLRVSSAFEEIVEQYQLIANPSRSEQDAYIYARDKVERARTYVDNLRRRRDTLLRTMREIARRQRDFFVSEDDDTLLHPLKLQDVADAVGLDISTVSRAAQSKYVETAFGIYPLRYFFNAQTMEHNGEQISSTRVKIALRELIESEDHSHPLSDERLVALMTERGYKIARRTVAKYRDQMGIATAQMRKKLKV